MGFTPTFAQVMAFMQDPSHMHGVLAYHARGNWPDTAFVAFSVTGQLEVIFGTSTASRKYKTFHNHDIALRDRVGFNVTDKERRYTVQLKGVMKELTSNQMALLESDHYDKLGEASKRFKNVDDQAFFIISPRYVVFTDCLEDPWTRTVVLEEI